MKKLVLAGVFAAVGTAAFASGYVAPPVMEPEVVVAHSSSSVGGVVIPLLLLILVAALAN